MGNIDDLYLQVTKAVIRFDAFKEAFDLIIAQHDCADARFMQSLPGSLEAARAEGARDALRHVVEQIRDEAEVSLAEHSRLLAALAESKPNEASATSTA